MFLCEPCGVSLYAVWCFPVCCVVFLSLCAVWCFSVGCVCFSLCVLCGVSLSVCCVVFLCGLCVFLSLSAV